MFEDRVLSHMKKVQYVTVYAKDLVSDYDKAYHRPFIGNTMLLLSKHRVYHENGYSLVLHNMRETMVSNRVHPSVYGVFAHYDYRVFKDMFIHYVKEDIALYVTEEGVKNYFGAGIGLMAIQNKVLTDITLKDIAKSRLERMW